MSTPPNKIRPPVVDDYDDKSQRQVRTAIQQLANNSAGRFLGRRVLSGTGVYNPTLGTTTAHVLAIGGGGGGGGASVGGGVGAGAGGSSGALLNIVITNKGPITGGAFLCGAGGAGGAAGLQGSPGGDTTFVINGTTYVAKGGIGGSGMTGTATNGDALPFPPAAGSSSGGFVTYGLGSEGTVDDGNAWHSGRGGGTELGGGGGQVGGSNAGLPADPSGFGGGGGGAAAASGVNRAGGAGAAGGVVIYEYS